MSEEDLYRQGRSAGIAAYLKWRRDLLDPRRLRTGTPTPRPECECSITREGWFDGFVWAQDNRYETW
jgi:hypothetical protein